VSGRIAITVLVLLASTRGAEAAAPDVCPTRNDPAAGPLAGGIGPADFGAVPEACGATDASLRVRGALLVASTMPDYYGSFVGSTTLRGRYLLGERSTLSFAADVFNYRYVNNASLASHGPSAGPATAAIHHTFLVGAATATSMYGRVLLPLDTARQNGVQTGLELGGSVRVRAGSRVVIDGGLALTAPADIVGGQAHLRLEPVALAEAWVRLRSWVALAGGLNTRLIAAPDFDLISTAPRLSARFALRQRFWAALLLELPVAGTDRTDLVAGLYAGFTPH
jgi:hypothetical protein